MFRLSDETIEQFHDYRFVVCNWGVCVCVSMKKRLEKCTIGRPGYRVPFRKRKVRRDPTAGRPEGAGLCALSPVKKQRTPGKKHRVPRRKTARRPPLYSRLSSKPSLVHRPRPMTQLNSILIIRSLDMTMSTFM